jgi:sugar phosphate isomerase/epimerase
VGVGRQLRAASVAGFDWFAIDVWTVRGFLATGRELDELQEVCGESGLECGQLQTLLLQGPEPFEDLVSDLASAARVLQPATVQVIAGVHSEETVVKLRQASARLRQAAPETVFAIEYTPMQPMNTIEAALDFVKATGVEGFGLNLDSWHFFVGPEEWSDLDRLSLEDVVHMQFSDHGPLHPPLDLADETMNRRLLPGEGTFDLTRFFAFVRELGYDGRGGVELLSEPLRSLSPEEYAPIANAAGRRFWGHR